MLRKVLGTTEIRNVTLRRKNPQTNLLDEIPITLRFRDVEVYFRDENDDPIIFDAKILENLLYSDEYDISLDENKALYIDFCIRNPFLKRGTQEFRDTLKADPYFNALRVKFGYAITCHKAQGSEWQHVFVKCRTNNTGLNKNYFRWLYTAITRSSKDLYLIDPPKYKLTSGLKVIATPVKTAESVVNSASSVSGASAAFSARATMSYVDNPLVAVNEDSTENFGLKEDSSFLLALLHKVRELLDGTGIKITSVIHNNFQEAYFFEDNAENVRINIWYKANDTISSILATKQTPLANRLISLLTTPLKSASFVTSQPVQHIAFPIKFLQDFYDEVVRIVSTHGITVQNVESKQYCQRYTFVRGKEVVKFNIWYNSNIYN